MEDKDFLYKDQLILEALKEFAEKGFDAASLNQIIKGAGISKGSFYHHFHGGDS
jgi:TetR/AcrR family transcriptional regulator